MSSSALSFTLSSPSSPYRLGKLKLRTIEIDTPNLTTSTSRGVIPHQSRDHYAQIPGWISIPFESFLEQPVPIPLLSSSYPSTHPLHTHLGLSPSHHLTSLTARSPTDARDMPPNGSQEVKVMTLRGVRKLSPSQWTSYVKATKPDVVWALSDVPWTRKDAPFSQKRMGKSLERGAAWLGEVLVGLKGAGKGKDGRVKEKEGDEWKPAVFLHLPGLATLPARQYFSQQLLEKIHPSDKESQLLAPLKTLDEGVDGYGMDLVPIRVALEALREKKATKNGSTSTDKNEDTQLPDIPTLLTTSLSPLPSSKPRTVTGVVSPHEILRLVRDVGVDMVDSEYLVCRLAGWGVGLDFEFPVRERSDQSVEGRDGEGKEKKGNGGKRDVGVNLYDEKYQMDFRSIGCTSFRGALEEPPTSPSSDDTRPICQCLACSPLSPPPSTILKHGLEPTEEDGLKEEDEKSRRKPPFTRAYIHHLLHTHEMSAHTLLLLHNHSVLSSFLAGIRDVIRLEQEDGEAKGGKGRFEEEVQRFEETYDEGMDVVQEAKGRWEGVERARGRGRLRREAEAEAGGEAKLVKGELVKSGNGAGDVGVDVVGDGNVDVPLKARGGGEIVEGVEETLEGRGTQGIGIGKGERVRGEGAVDL